MYTVIIPAAGMGKRMGSDKNKILMTIEGQSIVERTVSVFQADDLCDAIYLAARQDEIATLEEMLAEYNKVQGIIEGGSERQYSIYNVLKSIPPCDYIMVHDAARPFISHETLLELSHHVQKNHASIAAVKAKDTIKVVTDGKIESTPDRATLWSVQTPQAFQYALLKRAYRQAEIDGFVGTDDASLVERIGFDVHVVESNYDNIKITTPEDLYFAEAILKKRG